MEPIETGTPYPVVLESEAGFVPTLTPTPIPTRRAVTVDVRGSAEMMWRVMEVRVEIPLYGLVILVLALYLFAFLKGLHDARGKE